MQWLAKQFQNWVKSSDDPYGTGWASDSGYYPQLGNTLELQNGRRLKSLIFQAAANSQASYPNYWYMAGVGSFQDAVNGQIMAVEFAVEASSRFAFTIYPTSPSLVETGLSVYVNPTTKRVNSLGAYGNLPTSYGLYEMPYTAVNGQPVFVVWMYVTSNYTAGNRRDISFYPQPAESSSSSPEAGLFLGHVQVRDGGLDFATDPTYGLGPWVVTSGTAIVVGSLEAIRLDTPGATIKGQRLESKHESQAGKQYRYRWGARDAVSIPMTLVNCRDSTLINSFWKAEEDLVYFDDRNYIVVSGNIVNKDLPFSKHEKPLLDRWKGTIELEGY